MAGSLALIGAFDGSRLLLPLLNKPPAIHLQKLQRKDERTSLFSLGLPSFPRYFPPNAGRCTR
jgi:hypothetical protein